MSRVLARLLVALAPASLAAQEPAGMAPEAAQIEVHRGRAVLVSEGEPNRTLRRFEEASTEGETHLEVGAGSEVRLRWPGRASLHVWGPASMQWRDLEEGSDDPLVAFPEGGLRIEFFDLAWADIEVRRGRHELRLPGSWRAELGQGASHLRGLPHGPIELRHHAGSSVSLQWHGDPTRARPPVHVYPGSSLRLEPPEDAESEERNVQAWDRADWPWRERADTPKQVEERVRATERFARHRRGAQPWPGERNVIERAPVAGDRVAREQTPRSEPRTTDRARDPVARIPDFPVAPRVVVEPRVKDVPRILPFVRREESDDAAPQPVQEHARGPIQEPVPDPMPVPVSEDLIDPPSGEPLSEERWGDADSWRGLSVGQLLSAGPLVIQRASGVEVRVSARGSWKVFVDRLARGPIWCFGPDTDFLMQPGSIASFEPGGKLRLKFGDVRPHPAPVGRR